MKRKSYWIWILCTLFAVGTVWLRLTLVRMNYQIHEADRRIHELQLEKEKVELKAAALRSPLKLEALARTKFHLTQPRSDQVIHLQSAHPAYEAPKK